MKSYQPRVAKRQFVFLPGKGTEDAIYEVENIVRNSQKLYVLAIAFEIEGAFDHLWWLAVLKDLERRECAPALYGLIFIYLWDRKIAMEDNFEREEKRVAKGCPQGSILGPSLWNLVFDQLVIKLFSISEQIPPAADILIEGRKQSEIEDLVRKVTDDITSWCSDVKFTLSVRKTQAILLKGKLSRRPQLKVQSSTIQMVGDLKYLDQCV